MVRELSRNNFFDDICQNIAGCRDKATIGS